MLRRESRRNKHAYQQGKVDGGDKANGAVALHCSALQCVAVCCCVLQCVAVCCCVLQCVAVCCSALQCVAVCCSVLQKRRRTHRAGYMAEPGSALSRAVKANGAIAVRCIVLQCVAVCCSVLRCVAV